MSHRTPWAENLLNYLRRDNVRGLTPEEAVGMFGAPPGRQGAAERMENLEKNGQLRRQRDGVRVRYVIAPKASAPARASMFEGWGRGAPRVASVFDLARCGR